jgi:hypothetical protein
LVANIIIIIIIRVMLAIGAILAKQLLGAHTVFPRATL